MLTEERFHIILEVLEERQAVTVTELTQLLGASESTIRRDLTTLHQQGRLIKVHGGATALPAGYQMVDEQVEVRQSRSTPEKHAIGQYAASLIRDDDFVFIDAGTTTGAMLEYIGPTRAVFVTNAAGHGKKLAQKGLRVMLLGGEMKAATEAVVGSDTIRGLQRYHFTKGFFGTNGISTQGGYTTPDAAEAMVKEVAMGRCQQRFVLADHTKFHVVSSVTFGQLSDAVILTDRAEDDIWASKTEITEVEQP
ncbi:MAG: DeoR/GlpR family DNA-binding transcription regulator [Eubacteriales bacterium]|jgi:DeoR family fructose operon transcriptional repressor